MAITTWCVLWLKKPKIGPCPYGNDIERRLVQPCSTLLCPLHCLCRAARNEIAIHDRNLAVTMLHVPRGGARSLDWPTVQPLSAWCCVDYLGKWSMSGLIALSRGLGASTRHERLKALLDLSIKTAQR